MTTNARKTDAQRLGNGKKAFNVKQVEKIVEERSTEYTAGTGISISAENAISVDTTTIQEKLTAGEGITITENVISAQAGNFKLVENDTEFQSYIDNHVLTKDLIMFYDAYAGSGLSDKGFIYLPAGYIFPSYGYITKHSLAQFVNTDTGKYNLDSGEGGIYSNNYILTVYISSQRTTFDYTTNPVTVNTSTKSETRSYNTYNDSSKLKYYVKL